MKAWQHSFVKTNLNKIPLAQTMDVTPSDKMVNI